MRSPVMPLLFALLALSAASGHATTTAERGFERVAAALATLGGIEALDRAGGISWIGTGRDDIAARLKPDDAGAPDYYPSTEAFSYRVDDGRLAFETHSSLDGENEEWTLRVFDGNGRSLTVDRRFNIAYWDDSAIVDLEAARHRNMIAHELLASVLMQRGTLDLLPDQTFFGQVAHAVSGALADGTRVTLFIDADDALIGASYPLEVPTFGTVTTTWVYDALVHVEGLGLYPAGHRVYLDDRLIREVRYDELRAGPNPTLMAAPAGVRVPALPIPDRT